jgi:hypothetical protein
MARRRTPQSVIRRLSAQSRRPRADGRIAPPLAAVSTPPSERVDDAELDQLRAELVRELDSRAARDGGGSATFRRVA